MSKFNTMENVVLQVLEEQPETRADDYLLMLAVCERLNCNFMNYPFWVVIKNHNNNGLPNWETVTRCRRKIQEKRPDLVPPEAAKNRRKEEEEYREYAHT